MISVPLRVSQKFTGHLEQIRAELIIQKKEVGKNKEAMGEVRTPVWEQTPPVSGRLKTFVRSFI